MENGPNPIAAAKEEAKESFAQIFLRDGEHNMLSGQAEPVSKHRLLRLLETAIRLGATEGKNNHKSNTAEIADKIIEDLSKG